MIDVTKEGGAVSGAEDEDGFAVQGVSLAFDGRRAGHSPDQHMAQAGERLQDVVTDLEGLVFEAPDLGPRCRSEVHDAIGLVMDALQALGRAQAALKRSRASGTPRTFAVPMSRA
jgi:hypothetical protein